MTSLPSCPEKFSGPAAKDWGVLVGKLARLSPLTARDLLMVDAIVEAHGTRMALRRASLGATHPVAIAAAELSSAAWAALARKAAIELRILPRAVAPAPRDLSLDDDPIARLLDPTVPLTVYADPVVLED